MKKLLSTACATTLALSFAATSMVPATAAPVYAPPVTVVDTDIVQVQSGDRRRIERRGDSSWGDRDRRGGGDWDRRDRDRRGGGDWDRRDRDKSHYWKGHRGFSSYRPGYRKRGDFWFPLAAFAAGAIIASQPRVVVRSYGNSHVEWCYSRYKSYRAWDNTYQPYYGPRRQCNSPYRY